MNSTLVPDALDHLPSDLEMLEAICWADSDPEAVEALEALDRILPRLSDAQKARGIAHVAESLAFDAEYALEQVGEGEALPTDTLDKYPGWRDATRLYDAIGLRWKQVLHQDCAGCLETLLGAIYGMRVLLGRDATLRALESYGAGRHCS